MHDASDLGTAVYNLAGASQMPSKFPYTFVGNMYLLWYDKIHRREKDIERFCERENRTMDMDICNE